MSTDNQQLESQHAPRILRVTRKRLYIGGVISKVRRLAKRRGIDMTRGFNGCIRNFMVNGGQFNLMDEQRMLVPCVQSSAAYFARGSYATFGWLL